MLTKTDGSEKQKNNSDSYSQVLTVHPWLPRRDSREEEWRLGRALEPVREWAEQNGGGKESRESTNPGLFSLIYGHRKGDGSEQWYNLRPRLSPGLLTGPLTSLLIGLLHFLSMNFADTGDLLDKQ